MRHTAPATMRGDGSRVRLRSSASPTTTALRVLDTYAAVPAPKLVIAVGACAISGGPFIDNPKVHNGCGSIVPVELFIPGCPPHPLTILDGLLGRLDTSSDRAGSQAT